MEEEMEEEMREREMRGLLHNSLHLGNSGAKHITLQSSDEH